MPSFSWRFLILVAIASILIFRTVHKLAARRSGGVPTNARTPGNAFCIHCGGALDRGGQFCGGCGARRA
jgi:hypothetical protein